MIRTLLLLYMSLTYTVRAPAMSLSAPLPTRPILPYFPRSDSPLPPLSSIFLLLLQALGPLYDTKSIGGGIVIEGSGNHIITRTSFINNTASSMGGGLMLVASSHVMLSSLTFANNTAGLTGGGLYLSIGITYVGMLALTFKGNRAVQGSGGAMYVGPSCKFISLGGLISSLETCVGCANDYSGTATMGTRNQYLNYQVQAKTEFLHTIPSSRPSHATSYHIISSRIIHSTFPPPFVFSSPLK